MWLAFTFSCLRAFAFVLSFICCVFMFLVLHHVYHLPEVVPWFPRCVVVHLDLFLLHCFLLLSASLIVCVFLHCSWLLCRCCCCCVFCAFACFICVFLFVPCLLVFLFFVVLLVCLACLFVSLCFYNLYVLCRFVHLYVCFVCLFILVSCCFACVDFFMTYLWSLWTCARDKANKG